MGKQTGESKEEEVMGEGIGESEMEELVPESGLTMLVILGTRTDAHSLINQVGMALSKTCQDAGMTPGQYNRKRGRDSRDAVLSETVVQ